MSGSAGFPNTDWTTDATTMYVTHMMTCTFGMKLGMVAESESAAVWFSMLTSAPPCWQLGRPARKFFKCFVGDGGLLVMAAWLLPGGPGCRRPTWAGMYDARCCRCPRVPWVALRGWYVGCAVTVVAGVPPRLPTWAGMCDLWCHVWPCAPQVALVYVTYL